MHIFEESLFFKLRTTIQQKTVKPTYLLSVWCQEAGGRKRARDCLDVYRNVLAVTGSFNGENTTEAYSLSQGHFIKRTLQKHVDCHGLISWREHYRNVLTVTGSFHGEKITETCWLSQAHFTKRTLQKRVDCHRLISWKKQYIKVLTVLTHFTKRTLQKHIDCQWLISWTEQTRDVLTLKGSFHEENSTETYWLSKAHFIERTVQLKYIDCHRLILKRDQYSSNILTVISSFHGENSTV